MESGVNIQLPNPQEHIYNAQSFQQLPSSGGSGSSFFTLKNISMISVGVIVMIGVGMGVMSVKNATDSYHKKISQRSQEISEILDEASDQDSFQVVGQANASYDNPFDKDTSYENPFDKNENPFGE